MEKVIKLTRKKLIGDLLRRLDIPLQAPPVLEREEGPEKERPLEGRWVLVGPGGGGDHALEAARACAFAGAGFVVPEDEHYPGYGRSFLDEGAVPTKRAIMADAVDVCVYDAAGLGHVEDPDVVFSFLGRWVPRIRAGGRLIVLAEDHGGSATPRQHAVRGALGGIVRALSKEIGGRGVTAHLVIAPPDTGGSLGPLVRYLASRRSAFVTGQTWELERPEGWGPPASFVRLLEGKTALVTGAAQGIGAAAARGLAGEGAEVIVVDRPEKDEALGAVASDIGGTPLVVDLTWPRADSYIAEEVKKDGGRLDIVVHNAGVYLDRRLEDMEPDDWRRTFDVNLASAMRLTEALDPLVSDGGRIIGLSSIAGLTGIPGHVCYSGSKAGMAAYLRSLAGAMHSRRVTVNAVAPGFVYTELTSELSWLYREVGLKMSGLMQGGIPEDIANLVVFLAGPGSAGLTGRVIRACGGHYIGQ